MDTDNLLDIFFQMLRDIVESITLPTGKNLLPSFFYALAITLAALASKLAGFPVTFVDWRGGAIATVALGVLVFIERRGMDEVSRLYRVAKSRAATAAKRAKGPSPAVEAPGGLNPGDPELPED